MTLRHPGISPTNDLVAKKIFSNPEITCQFIRDMLELPAKNVTILEGSNIHVLPSHTLLGAGFLYQYRCFGGVGQWDTSNY